MNRRGFLFLGLSTSACLLMGHTPYRQWQVYRKSRLIFVVSEMDEVSLRLGSTIAPALAARVPESKAMMATAATAVDVVKLLTSAQLDVALLTSDDAYEALQGAGRFKGPAAPLRTLAARTGGSFAEASSTARLASIYESLGKRLASEYLVRYRSDALPHSHVEVLGCHRQGHAAVVVASLSFSVPDSPNSSVRHSSTSSVVSLSSGWKSLRL